MSDLPPEITTTILARLPVKSLLRFRCVSKPWRSLIDGQDFTKLHLLHQSAKTNTYRTLIVESNHPDLDSLERLDIGNIPEYLQVKVEGSCNGLLLVSDSFSKKMFLWNPNTRKQNELPPPPRWSLKAAHCSIVLYDLGYDSMHDDYKVVRLIQALSWSTGVLSSSSTVVCSETTIYSLKTNSWKKVAGDFPHELIHGGSGCCVNDALHFVVGHELKIMAFDVAKEEYNEVPKPESAAGVILSLCSDGRRLVLVGDKREVWVMNEYGVKGSWCKLTNSFDGVISLQSLAFSEGGVEGLFNYYEGTRWYCFGNKKNKITVAHVEGSSGFLDVDMVFGSSFGAWVCFESLVSPFSTYEGWGKRRRIRG